MSLLRQPRFWQLDNLYSGPIPLLCNRQWLIYKPYHNDYYILDLEDYYHVDGIKPQSLGDLGKIQQCAEDYPYLMTNHGLIIITKDANRDFSLFSIDRLPEGLRYFAGGLLAHYENLTDTYIVSEIRDRQLVTIWQSRQLSFDDTSEIMERSLINVGRDRHGIITLVRFVNYGDIPYIIVETTDGHFKHYDEEQISALIRRDDKFSIDGSYAIDDFVLYRLRHLKWSDWPFEEDLSAVDLNYHGELIARNEDAKELHLIDIKTKNILWTRQYQAKNDSRELTINNYANIILFVNNEAIEYVNFRYKTATILKPSPHSFYTNYLTAIDSAHEWLIIYNSETANLLILSYAPLDWSIIDRYLDDLGQKIYLTLLGLNSSEQVVPQEVREMIIEEIMRNHR